MKSQPYTLPNAEQKESFLGYYVCTKEGRVLAGPWPSAAVSTYINLQPEPERYSLYNASRYILAKDKSYPESKKGRSAILEDLRTSPLQFTASPPTLHVYESMWRRDEWKEEVRAWAQEQGVEVHLQ